MTGNRHHHHRIALLPVAALDAVGGGANPDPTSSKNLAYAMARWRSS